MPFGESFISTIKSNKSIMLDKGRRFKRANGGFDWSKSQQFSFKEATPKQLKIIRDNLRRDKREIRIKQFVVLIVIMSISVSIFCYLMF